MLFVNRAAVDRGPAVSHYSRSASYSSRRRATSGSASIGIVVKDNTFSGTAIVADVYLGSATASNEVTVDAGTNVVDLAPPGSNVIQFD